MTGRSLRSVISGASARTHPVDAPVGVEVSGNAALFKGDMKLVRNMPPRGDGEWHLYDIARDPGETADLSSEQSALAHEMLADYETYTREMGVLPMPDGYDIHRQVVRNALERQLGFYGWALGLAVLLVAMLAARRARRAR
jgi:arylsulfatase/uncharacterized sulfatase